MPITPALRAEVKAHGQPLFMAASKSEIASKQSKPRSLRIVRLPQGRNGNAPDDDKKRGIYKNSPRARFNIKSLVNASM